MVNVGGFGPLTPSLLRTPLVYTDIDKYNKNSNLLT